MLAGFESLGAVEGVEMRKWGMWKAGMAWKGIGVSRRVVGLRVTYKQRNVEIVKFRGKYDI